MVPAGLGEDQTACQENQEKMNVTVSGDNININITGGVDALNEWTSSNPSQAALGPKHWLALDIDTGVDITTLNYNGSPLTSADVAEAAEWGLGEGHIILWLKAEDTYPKTITLSGDAYNTKTITITL